MLSFIGLLLAFALQNDLEKFIKDNAKSFGTLIKAYSLRLLSYIAFLQYKVAFSAPN